MTSKLDRRGWSAGDRRRALAYFRDLAVGIVGYLVVLLAVIAWGDLGGSSGWRFVWALLPVLPVLWMVKAVVRYLGRIDEYARLVQLRGLACGFVVAMVTALTVGFLEIAGLQLTHGMAGWSVYLAGMVGWGVAAGVASRA